MPIYEYDCKNCGRISTFLIRNIHAPFSPKCQGCQSIKITRLISRVARVRSEESRLEALCDPSKIGDIDENNPASMARWMKRTGKELGEDIGDDFDSLMDEAGEEGSSSIEESLGTGEDDLLKGPK